MFAQPRRSNFYKKTSYRLISLLTVPRRRRVASGRTAPSRASRRAAASPPALLIIDYCSLLIIDLSFSSSENKSYLGALRFSICKQNGYKLQ